MRTTTTTPQINALIGWTRGKNHAAHGARFLAQFFDEVCQTTTWNFQSYLRLWRRQPAAVNLSSFAFTWKPFVLGKRKCTSPVLYNMTIIAEHLTIFFLFFYIPNLHYIKLTNAKDAIQLGEKNNTNWIKEKEQVRITCNLPSIQWFLRVIIDRSLTASASFLVFTSFLK